MQPPLFIVNPACGTRKAGDEITRLLARVGHLYGEVTVRYTERRGHAEELAFAGAGDGHPLIVAVGGDGTFGEVVNGVLRAEDEAAEASSGGGAEQVSEAGGGANPARDSTGAAADPSPGLPAVGLVSIGTGGDFRRTLGIEAGIEASLEALATGTDRRIDVMRAEFRGPDGATVRRYVVNVLSAGLGGMVDRYIEATPSFVPGRAGYYAAALRAAAVSTQQPVRARITWQGDTREEIMPAYLIAVCNGRWFGGGMDVAPMALPDDGRLELVTVAAPTKPYLLRHIKSVYEGRHLDLPSVHHCACERIELGLEDPGAEARFLLDVDGDALGSLPLSVEVAPKRLLVRA
jgi:diacylglycerol kinase family enzyme